MKCIYIYIYSFIVKMVVGRRIRTKGEFEREKSLMYLLFIGIIAAFMSIMTT